MTIEIEEILKIVGNYDKMLKFHKENHNSLYNRIFNKQRKGGSLNSFYNTTLSKSQGMIKLVSDLVNAGKSYYKACKSYLLIREERNKAQHVESYPLQKQVETFMKEGNITDFIYAFKLAWDYVFVISYIGVHKEQGALNYLAKAYPAYNFSKASEEWDRIYAIDLLVKDKQNQLIGVIQVKPSSFKLYPQAIALNLKKLENFSKKYNFIRKYFFYYDTMTIEEIR